jgi:hypothetical protein
MLRRERRPVRLFEERNQSITQASIVVVHGIGDSSDRFNKLAKQQFSARSRSDRRRRQLAGDRLRVNEQVIQSTTWNRCYANVLQDKQETLSEESDNLIGI